MKRVTITIRNEGDEKEDVKYSFLLTDKTTIEIEQNGNINMKINKEPNAFTQRFEAGLEELQ